MTDREIKKYAVIGLITRIGQYQEAVKELTEERKIVYYNCKIADMEIQCDKLINELLNTPETLSE
jgi:hypothetical protein